MDQWKWEMEEACLKGGFISAFILSGFPSGFRLFISAFLTGFYDLLLRSSPGSLIQGAPIYPTNHISHESMNKCALYIPRIHEQMIG